MRSASEPTTVSIITPSFNQGHFFLSKPIKSAFDQQGDFNIEYTIVDRCSLDDSLEDIVNKICNVCHDTRIREQLVSNGYKRDKLFQWEKTKETNEVCRNALEILSRGTVFPDRGARV